MAPYRQIVDLNQPGTYAVEATVMWFGKGALAWRIFDLMLLFTIGVAMLAICRSPDIFRGWFSAMFAAVTFALIHGRDGLIQLGQRDLLMAVLLVIAFALLLEILRRERRAQWVLSFCAGLCIGAAATVKPDVIVLPPALIVLVALELQHRKRSWGRHVSLICVGIVLPVLAALIFLLREHALIAYLTTVKDLTVYHTSIWRLPAWMLFFRSISSVLLPVFCLWLALFILDRRWQVLEDRLLLLGFLFGVASFCVQGRGYSYHRYPSEVFLLVLAGTAFTSVLRPVQITATHFNIRQYAATSIACAGLTFSVLVVVPRSLASIQSFDGHLNDFERHLSADLTRLGGLQLSGNVQCMEMADGCITTLYKMQLVESSGFLYDCYLYPVDDQARMHIVERERYRNSFKQAFLLHPPRVIVVSSNECGPPDFAYGKLERWPWLASYLHAHYSIDRDQLPSELERWGGRPALSYGYRIYTIK